MATRILDEHSERLLLEQLHAADSGELELRVDGSSYVEAWAEDVAFVLSNGWRVTVTKKGYEWGYIDHMIAPDGRRWDSFDGDAAKRMPDRVAYWRPKHLERWSSASSVLRES